MAKDLEGLFREVSERFPHLRDLSRTGKLTFQRGEWELTLILWSGGGHWGISARYLGVCKDLKYQELRILSTYGDRPRWESWKRSFRGVGDWGSLVEVYEAFLPFLALRRDSTGLGELHNLLRSKSGEEVEGWFWAYSSLGKLSPDYNWEGPPFDGTDDSAREEIKIDPRGSPGDVVLGEKILFSWGLLLLARM